jgi:Methylamine utilisation protein MauE
VNYLAVGAMATLGWLFGTSGLSKTRTAAARNDLRISLRALTWLPKQAVGPVAATLSLAEIALALGCAVAIAASILRLPGHRAFALTALVSASALVAILTVGVGATLRSGEPARCACFGRDERPISRVHLLRNALLLLIAIAGVGALARSPGEPIDAASGALAVAVGVILSVILVNLDDIVTLFKPLRSRL